MVVPAGVVDELPLNVQVRCVHGDVKAATGCGVLTVDGMTIVQAMPLAPAIDELAVTAEAVPASSIRSAAATVIRPEPEPTDVLREVTVPGRVQPLFSDVLSDQ